MEDNLSENMPRRNPKRYKRNIFDSRGYFDDNHDISNFEKLSGTNQRKRRSKRSDRIRRRRRV